MPKAKATYVCTECGHTALQWAGKCPACGEWNTLQEQIAVEEKKFSRNTGDGDVTLTRISDVTAPKNERIDLGSTELNRVLGGGAVEGSLVLIGGEPGIGKSTLLLQSAAHVAASAKVYYFSGEESAHQIKMRAVRLKVSGRELFLAGETNIDRIVRKVIAEKPAMIVVDSLQTLYTEDSNSIPGSIAQIKNAAAMLLKLAKEAGITVFIIGHITKEGTLAGPKILEHTVDCVLYFEGDTEGQYRIIRSVKNRFGSVDEIGVFEMRETGLADVEDPSGIFARDRNREIGSGTVFAPVIEGSRVFCVEEQALVNTSVFGYPRRLAMGFDQNRLLMLCAILEKRASVALANQDVHVNIAQGLRVRETASDLSVAMAIVSSLTNVAISRDTGFIGELGLSGEIRSVRFVGRRVREMKKFGIHRILVPAGNADEATAEGLSVIPVNTVREAIEKALT
ncbi:MAG: DNA repair protein RadA [Spirochaetes bacterium]|nr:DNA repair protein RadA [Spirochaetota bacterium]